MNEYKPGDIVEHILTKDWLVFLYYSTDNNRLVCRTKDYQIIEFIPQEIKRRT